MTKIKFPQKAADNHDHTREHMRIFCLEFNSSILLHQHTTETLFESTTRCAEKPDIHESKGKIRAQELPAKLLYYFYEVIKATSINQVSRTFISLVVRVIKDPVGIQVWHAESMKRWRFTRFFKLG